MIKVGHCFPALYRQGEERFGLYAERQYLEAPEISTALRRWFCSLLGKWFGLDRALRNQKPPRGDRYDTLEPCDWGDVFWGEAQ